MIPFMHELEKVEKKITQHLGIRFEAWPLFILGMSIFVMCYVFMPNAVTFAMSIALFLAPVWMPYLLIKDAWKIWIVLRRSEFIAAQKYILLEIKPPRNLVKTPLAMEAFLSSINLTGGEATWYARFKGGMRPSWSLEIASFEGQVHFFIWGRAAFRRVVESQLYAQYPGVQITEAPDYTRTISAKTGEWVVWGCDYKHTNSAPMPIKTYVEYGLDKIQEEPEQVDPLSNLVEFMASIGKGEYLWLQFVIRAHRGERYGAGPSSHVSTKLNEKGQPYTWKDEAEEIVQAIRRKTRDSYFDAFTGQERPGFPNPTKGQMEKMAAIERNVSKLAFDVGARGIYLSRPAHFNAIVISHLIGLFRPFSTEEWNGIGSTKWMKTFDDYPWEINVEKRKEHYRREMIEAYRRRQYFYDPFFEGGVTGDESMIMSTEELATVYHIPSGTIATPGLERLKSPTAEAPLNLPM
ncbi:MAG: hypothetical protein WCT45_02180 [Candidatus Paceibacterota bacterium]|jgi:hypothetical protein